MSAQVLISMDDKPSDELRRELSLGAQIIDPPDALTLWLSKADLSEIGPALARALLGGQVRSAALLFRTPPPEQRWLVYEWRGALVAERELAGLVGPEWEEDHDHRHELVVVFRPRPAEVSKPDVPQVEMVGSADAYRQALGSAAPTAIYVEVGAVLDALPDWFGDLADDRVGGAIALLMLSGASSPSERIVLGNPAALGLSLESRPHDLIDHYRARRISARVFGVSWHQLRHPEHVVEELGLRVTPEALSMAAMDHTGGASFGILLELKATVDPQVVVPRGRIFEQTALRPVQTLTVAEPREVDVDVGDLMPLAVPAWCLNASLSAPRGERLRPTPLMMSLTGAESQGNVWRNREDTLARLEGAR
jgi:hypothetical protein